MNYQKFVDRLSRMTALAEGWQKSESLPAIERDLMLEELRGLYDELLDFKGDSGLAERVGATIMADTATEPIFDDVLDIDALLGLSDVERDEPKQEEVAVEPEVEVVPEPEIEVEVEVEPEPEPEPMSEPEPIAEPEPMVAPKGNGGLFDMEDIPVRTRSSRKMISLYTSPFAAETKPKAEEPKVEPVAKQEPKAEPAIVPEPKVEAKPEPAPVPTPVPAPAPTLAPTPQPTAEPVRLGDVLGGKTTTLADKMADDSAPTAAFNRITDLRKAIGLNDKFLMIRDLFDGDAARYEDTITTLNEFDDLDECMIYIVENFVWNPDSEGAKLLVSLIERKLA